MVITRVSNNHIMERHCDRSTEWSRSQPRLTKERKHFWSTGKSGATMSPINGLTVFLYSIENDFSLLYVFIVLLLWYCFCFFICICVYFLFFYFSLYKESEKFKHVYVRFWTLIKYKFKKKESVVLIFRFLLQNSDANLWRPLWESS